MPYTSPSPFEETYGFPYEDPIRYARESLAAEESLPVEPAPFATEESQPAPPIQQEAVEDSSDDVSEYPHEAITEDELKLTLPEPIGGLSGLEGGSITEPSPTDEELPEISLPKQPRYSTLYTTAPELPAHDEELAFDFTPHAIEEVLDVLAPTITPESDLYLPDTDSTPQHEELEFPEITSQDSATLDLDAPQIAEPEQLEAPVAPLDLSPPDSLMEAFSPIPSFEESMREFESIAQGETGYSFDMDDITPNEVKQVNQEMATKAMIEREMLFRNLNEL